MKRRELLAILAAAPLRGQGKAAELTILPEELGIINPRIYGQFTEHIGRLIYEGIWVGANSRIPNRNGYRLDTLGALERVGPRCFAGPAGASPMRINGRTAWVRGKSGPCAAITGGCAKSRTLSGPTSSWRGASNCARNLTFR